MEESAVKDRKAYEEEYFGGMWQADTCCLSYIREDGKSRRVYLIMILDDHSRMIAGGKLYYQENAANFQKTLKDAIAACGIPNRLYVDNGSPYGNGQLSFICGPAGTVLLHTPVRTGKGRAERNSRTPKERWLYGLNVSQIKNLEEFDRLLPEYIRQHNTTKHGGTGRSPLERYMASNGRIHRPVNREWLDEVFHNRMIRNVNRDATVRLLDGCHDAPMQSNGQKVDVRFLPGDTRNAYILYGGQHYPLCLTDRVANGRTKRQTALSIGCAEEDRGDVH